MSKAHVQGHVKLYAQRPSFIDWHLSFLFLLRETYNNFLPEVYDTTVEPEWLWATSVLLLLQWGCKSSHSKERSLLQIFRLVQGWRNNMKISNKWPVLKYLEIYHDSISSSSHNPARCLLFGDFFVLTINKLSHYNWVRSYYRVCSIIPYKYCFLNITVYMGWETGLD